MTEAVSTAHEILDRIEEYRRRRAVLSDPKERARCDQEIKQLIDDLLKSLWLDFRENGKDANTEYMLLLAQSQALAERMEKFEQALEVEREERHRQHGQNLLLEWNYRVLKAFVVGGFVVDLFVALVLALHMVFT
jgi:hypothetical protein